jgi:hypothetical protein
VYFRTGACGALRSIASCDPQPRELTKAASVSSHSKLSANRTQPSDPTVQFLLQSF